MYPGNIICSVEKTLTSIICSFRSQQYVGLLLSNPSLQADSSPLL